MTKYYRADRRCFKPKDVMRPEGTYQNHFKEAGKAMEKALEDARPRHKKPNRKESLFVFDDLEAVQRHWRTHDGSYLYEVEIDEATVSHCGDMEFMDQIGAEFRKRKRSAHRCRDQASRCGGEYVRPCTCLDEGRRCSMVVSPESLTLAP